MDKVSKEKLFYTIVSSQILAPYLPHEPELGVLLEDPHHCNIHYPRSFASAEQIAVIFERRLNYMVAKQIYSNLEATRQLVRFIKRHPDSKIYDVTFNCERQHYGVCCGGTEEQLQVICVLTGGHIPEEAFGEK